MKENAQRKGIARHWVHKLGWHITPVIVYSLYIAMGNKISLSMIVITKMYFGKLFWLLWVGPYIFECYNKLKLSVGKI